MDYTDANELQLIILILAQKLSGKTKAKQNPLNWCIFASEFFKKLIQQLKVKKNI